MIPLTSSGVLGCHCGAPSNYSGATWRLAAGAFLAVNSMVLALAVNTSGPLSSDTKIVQLILLGVTALMMVLLGGPFARRAFHELRAGQVTIESLFLLGLAAALGISAHSQYSGGGPVYYEIANILLVVYSFGRHLSAEAQSKVEGLLAQSLPGIDRCEVLEDDGTTRELEIEAVCVAQRIRIHPGRVVPIDGIVRLGTALVHESQLTGESFVVRKQPGDQVFAGSHIVDATLVVEAIVAGRGRRIDRIEELIRGAQSRQGTSQRLANTLAARFVPLVAGLAGFTFLVWWRIASAETAVLNALAVLLVACPCALGFATPVAFWATLARLSGGGVFLRSGAAVENLAEVQVAIFDKTGTLTNPAEVSVSLTLLPGQKMSPADITECLAIAEAASDHPLARAIASIIPREQRRGRALQLQILPGVGIEAEVRLENEDHTVRVGVLAWLDSSGQDSSRLGIEIDGFPSAILDLEEQQHAGIEVAVNTLEDMGLQTVLLTGDNSERAGKIPVREVRHHCSPEEKLSYVRERHGKGQKVLFVGDGINDAAAMAESEVSLTPFTASPLAKAVSDGEWRDQSVESLIGAIKGSRDAMKTVRTNLWIALGYNSIGIAIAAFGFLHPVTASLLMTASSMTVTWRALRLLTPPRSIKGVSPRELHDEVLA